MEPMLPGQHPKLAELSQEVLIRAGSLSSMLPAEKTRQAVSAVVREMNSYYSNLIEGHKTLPQDIERALKKDMSPDKEERHNQHLAAAHIRAETVMEQRLQDEAGTDIHSRDFLCWLHNCFYKDLPEELLYSKTKSGEKHRIEPGCLRSFNVDVAAHTPPDYSRLLLFLERFRVVYGDKNILATDALVAVAAAHHRLVWIHPFADGNGRVARLYSHACLMRQKVNGLGLWTLSRGLARSRKKYYDFLSAADRSRHSDYDGRGNLTAKGLVDFCVFFLETILDQISFMGSLLELPVLLTRIENYIHREATEITRHKDRLIRLLKAVATEGLISRGRVPDIVGLKPSAARQVTKLGLDAELIRTESPKGPLSIAFPAKVLDSYLPRLFIDL